MLCQKSSHAGHYRCTRLAAGNHEAVEGRLHLLDRQHLLILVARYEAHEIRTSGFHGQAVCNLLVHNCEELSTGSKFGRFLGKQRDSALKREAAFDRDYAKRLHPLEGYGHPLMVEVVAQMVKRSSESQISDHVEGGVVLPTHQVDFVLRMFSDLSMHAYAFASDFRLAYSRSRWRR